jgi:hypothetical protein
MEDVNEYRSLKQAGSKKISSLRFLLDIVADFRLGRYRMCKPPNIHCSPNVSSSFTNTNSTHANPYTNAYPNR